MRDGSELATSEWPMMPAGGGGGVATLGWELSDRLARLVGNIGRDGFEESLAVLLLSAASIDQCNVFQLDGSEAIRCLFQWRRLEPAKGSDLVDRYLAGPFSLDPALRRLRQAGAGRQSISFLRSRDIEDDWYRRQFFDAPSLGGKMSVFEPGDAFRIYLNFYNGRSHGDFSASEVANLAWLSKVVSLSLVRHHELTAGSRDMPGRCKPAAIARLLRDGAPRLTERELEVCSRIVGGYTTEAIALDLGVAYGSVATYRRRAYAKLGISSHHELFALCLAARSKAVTRQ